MILKSEDGGASWDRVADLPGEFYPRRRILSMPSAAGWSGLTARSCLRLMAGQSWQSQDSGTQVSTLASLAAVRRCTRWAKMASSCATTTGTGGNCPRAQCVVVFAFGECSNDGLVVAGGNGVVLTVATDARGGA